MKFVGWKLLPEYKGKNQMRLCYSYLEEDIMMMCIDEIGEAVQRILKKI